MILLLASGEGGTLHVFSPCLKAQVGLQVAEVSSFAHLNLFLHLPRTSFPGSLVSSRPLPLGVTWKRNPS